jgi:hypothetical protein
MKALLYRAAVLALALALLFIALGAKRSGRPSPAGGLQVAGPANAAAQKEGLPCPGAALSPSLPHEVSLQTPGQPVQNDFDCFSWQSLVALNWPVSATNGEPEPKIDFGHTGRDGLVTWMTYKQPAELFLAGGANPCGCDTSDPKCRETCWNALPALPAVCGNQGTAAKVELFNTSKAGSFLDSAQQAVPNVWLTDQNRNLARFEVRMNRDVFDFIATHKYYDGRNQWSNPQATFILPAGEDNGPAGAVDVKAAWRIVKKEEEDRFFTVDAVILDTKIDVATGRPDPNGRFMTCNQASEGPCCRRRVGLVGFHIAHKTKQRPQWVWSTFEHIDNAPTEGEAPVGGMSYSFFNPNCGAGPQCVSNQNPRKAHLPVNIPVQVERVVQKDAAGKPRSLPKEVNDQWHDLVRETVWRNYILVSTQWPTNPSSKTGNPEPAFLANTTLETYNQVPDPATPRSKPSSCINCHLVASGLNGKSGDFSFLFSKARPAQGAPSPKP